MQIIFFFLPTEFSSSIVNFCCCCKKGEKYFKKNRGRGKDSPRAENLHKAGLPFQRRNGSRRAHAAAPLGIRNKRHARGLHKGRGTDSIALHRDQHPRPPSGYRGKPAAGGTHGPSLAQGPRPPRQYSPRRSRAKWLKDCIRRPSGLRALHPNSSAPARPQAPRAGGVALEESGPEQRTGPQDAALAPLPPAGDQGLSGPPAPPQPPQPPPHPPPPGARHQANPNLSTRSRALTLSLSAQHRREKPTQSPPSPPQTRGAGLHFPQGCGASAQAQKRVTGVRRRRPVLSGVVQVPEWVWGGTVGRFQQSHGGGGVGSENRPEDVPLQPVKPGTVCAETLPRLTLKEPLLSTSRCLIRGAGRGS